ncbi:hypothetical protein AB0I22_13060 [Streptomyces sp. NPDC050610]|uniref:hypothetical protein n=1 Tax=Streptomyces sp. NPDC050610 TaxID=3157097 RepID=UPI0034481E80
MRHARPAAAVLLAAACLLTACSSSDGDSTKATASPSQAAKQQEKKATTPTAKEVGDKLTTAIPTHKTIVVYTEASDPNHLLGRPGGYASKTAFADSRIPKTETDGERPDAIVRGGSIEAYPDEAGAKVRRDYLAALAKTNPLMKEYDYLHGTAVLRVSAVLTPTQAKEYEKALATIG